MVMNFIRILSNSQRWAEYYEDLASDVTNHSRDHAFWENRLNDYPISSRTWDINAPITLTEIRDVVRKMKNHKAPGPDGIPIEF
jgi:hypothetical protein